MAEIDFSQDVDMPSALPSKKGGLGLAQTPSVAPGEIDFSKVQDLQYPTAPEPQYRAALGSGAQKGALSLIGMPADLSQAANAIPEMGMRAGMWAREKMGLQTSPEDRAQVEQRIQAGRQAAEDRRGKNLPSMVSQQFGGPELKYPTTEELAHAAQPYAEKAFGVGPATEFNLPQEKIAKAVTEMAPQAALGPAKGIVSRFVSGGVGGGASEAAGQYAEGTPYELPARLVGAVAAPKAAESAIDTAKKVLGAVFTSESAAKKALGETIKDYAAESGKQAQLLSNAPGVKQSAEGIVPRMRDFTNRLLGTTHDSPAIQEMLTAEGYQTRKQFYDAVKDLPSAQAIETPAINALHKQDVFQEAEKAAMKNAGSVPEFGLVAPTGPASPGKLTSDARGNWITVGAKEATPANLAYYNQVKMELDSIYEQAIRTGNTTKASAAKLAKDKLLGELDLIVPEYQNARGIAADTFTAASAPEAGAKFFTLTDNYGIDQFKRAFDSYNTVQKQAFQAGLMGRLEQEIASKNPNVLTQRFLGNPQFMQKLEHAMGPEMAGQVRAKVLSENLLQQADKIRATVASSNAVQQAASPSMRGALSALGTAGLAGLTFEYQAVLNMLQSAGVNPNWAIGALVSAGAGAAKGLVMSKAEQSIANTMVDLIQRNDPKTYAQINRLMSEHPQVYQKLTGTMTLINQATESQREGQNAPQQSSGGRIGRASGGSVVSSNKADQLIKAAESAKKAINSRTEVLLDQPDEKIAGALAIAKRHI